MMLNNNLVINSRLNINLPTGEVSEESLALEQEKENLGNLYARSTFVTKTASCFGKSPSANLNGNVGISAIVICFCYLFIFPTQAHANPFARLGNYFVQSGDKIAKVGDITDKNSDARRILRQMDISNPNSPTCNVLRTGGDDVSSAAATSGPKGMAVAAAIQTAKKICGNAAQGKIVDSEQAEIDMAVMYQTQLAIEQAKQSGQTERVRILEASKFKLEQLQQDGETERTKIVQSNLLAITLSNNETQVKLGEQNLQAIESNNWARVKQTDINAQAQIEIAKIQTNGSVDQVLIQAGSGLLTTLIAPPSREEEIRAETERKRIAAEIEIAKINAETERQRIAAANNDPGLALIQKWKLTTTACSNSSVVSIDIDDKQYCVFPTSSLRAGQYVYNRSTKKLELLTELSLPQ
jgi:hypothetical protein